MGFFYFDLHVDASTFKDEYGADCDPDRVADEATAILIQHARERDMFGGERTYACVVRDEAGSVCFKATLEFLSEDLPAPPAS